MKESIKRIEKDIKIFLKKTNKKSVNTIVNTKESFCRTKAKAS